MPSRECSSPADLPLDQLGRDAILHGGPDVRRAIVMANPTLRRRLRLTLTGVTLSGLAVVLGLFPGMGEVIPRALGCLMLLGLVGIVTVVVPSWLEERRLKRGR
jgi:hypothetical protein